MGSIKNDKRAHHLVLHVFYSKLLKRRVSENKVNDTPSYAMNSITVLKDSMVLN